MSKQCVFSSVESFVTPLLARMSCRHDEEDDDVPPSRISYQSPFDNNYLGLHILVVRLPHQVQLYFKKQVFMRLYRHPSSTCRPMTSC